jgi:hypothetical protein
VVAVALSAAAATSSLDITASVVEGGVDSGLQRDSPSKTFRQPPRVGRAVSAAAAAAALPMGQNASVFVSKGAYAYWSLDVTPGYELRCSLQVSWRSTDPMLLPVAHALQAAGGTYVALLAASRQLPVVTNPTSYSVSLDVSDASSTSLFIAQSDSRYRSGTHTLAAHALSSGRSALVVAHHP